MINVMPVGQVNANLGDDLVMRVGIPHAGDRLSFHAFESDFPVMVSASAFWDPAKAVFRIPKASNVHELDMALDSTGYTAMRLWQSKGAQAGLAGLFPWRLSQYVELTASLGVSWWSQPDMCCEPEIARDPAQIDFRINATAALLEASLRQVYA